jgi:hypothetical protein
MIRRGDLHGRPPGMGARPCSLAVSKMNEQHAPPTGNLDRCFLGDKKGPFHTTTCEQRLWHKKFLHKSRLWKRMAPIIGRTIQ